MPGHELSAAVGGRYLLHEVLGRGGMGTVWQGEDSLLQRAVAVKRIDLPVHLAPEERVVLRRRVQREARAAARVTHPRLVTVFDVVDEDDTVYLVQELVRAPSLKQLVADQGPRDPVEAARIGCQLVEALGALHRAGVVHRDVKPANVMVLPEGGIKLADFGVASIVGDPQLTTTGMIVGSPAFMAPEQARGAPPGPPADLWAVGATLYFAVEGEPPFGRADTLSTLTAVVHDPPRPPVRAGPLAPVLERLLAKEPADRPEGPEAARLLGSVLGGARREGGAGAPGPAAAAAPPAPAAPPSPPAPSPPAPSPPAPPPAASAGASAPPAPRAAGAPAAGRGRALALMTALVAAALAAGLVLAAVLGGDGDGPAPAAPATTAGPGAGQGAGTTATVEGSGPATPPPGWAVHTDPDTGYRVSYPAGWQVRERSGTLTDFVDPAGGRYLRVDWTDDPGESPEAAWRALSQSFGSRHANYRELRIEPTTYQGHRAALWEYTYDDDGASLHAYNLGFVTGDHGFALNFQAREDQWEQSQPVWEQLKAGFVVPGGAGEG